MAVLGSARCGPSNHNLSTVSFGPLVAAVVSKASNRCRALASLTTKRWLWRKDQLLNVYQHLHLSVFNYASPR